MLTITTIACHSNGLATVPICSYASSSHVSHIIQKTSLKILITEPDHLSRVLSLAKGSSLKYIVVAGAVTSENKKQAQDVGIELLTFEQVEEKGKTETYEAVQVGKQIKRDRGCII